MLTLIIIAVILFMVFGGDPNFGKRHNFEESYNNNLKADAPELYNDLKIVASLAPESEEKYGLLKTNIEGFNIAFKENDKQKIIEIVLCMDMNFGQDNEDEDAPSYSFPFLVAAMRAIDSGFNEKALDFTSNMFNVCIDDSAKFTHAHAQYLIADAQGGDQSQMDAAIEGMHQTYNPQKNFIYEDNFYTVTADYGDFYKNDKWNVKIRVMKKSTVEKLAKAANGQNAQ